MVLKVELPAANTGLAKVAAQCSADTFVVKIATFAKPKNVICNPWGQCKSEHLLTVYYF
jgi:hypothetical protein